MHERLRRRGTGPTTTGTGRGGAAATQGASAPPLIRWARLLVLVLRVPARASAVAGDDVDAVVVVLLVDDTLDTAGHRNRRTRCGCDRCDAWLIYEVRPDLHLRLLRLTCELDCFRKLPSGHPGVCSELRCLPCGRHDLGQLLAVADAQLGEDTVEVA